MKENRVGEILSVALPLLGLVGIAFLGFSDNTKQAAREQQHGICPVCGNKLCTHKHVEGHHKLPKSRGGNNSLDNCVMVGGDVRGLDCHEKLDRNALDRGLIFISPEQPEVPISEVPDSLGKAGLLGKLGNIFKHHPKKHHSNKHGNHGRR